jgi:quinol monooxygenase YgiN
MIVRIVRMTFKEEAVADFLENFHKHKKLIRAFEGCERLLLLQDVKETNVYLQLVARRRKFDKL